MTELSYVTDGSVTYNDESSRFCCVYHLHKHSQYFLFQSFTNAFRLFSVLSKYLKISKSSNSNKPFNKLNLGDGDQ